MEKAFKDPKLSFKMWAFLVLALAVIVRASDTTNNTAVEEKLVIARGKLLVSMHRNIRITLILILS